MKRRIVITGRGVILPNANSIDSMMQNLYNGVSSIENVSSRFDWLKGYRSQLGSLFNGFIFENNKMGIEDKSVKRLGPSVMYSLEAAYQAITESGFLDYVNRDRASCIIGHGLCGIIECERQNQIIFEKGLSRVDPNLCLKALPDSSPGFVSLTWGLNGECASVATACASGKTAIRYGANAIKNNEADVLVCGGTVEDASQLIFSCFGQIRAMSERNDEPKRASRPFDRDRDGFVLGEGAGIIILEELEHAKKRGARIYGELLGCCGNTDAYHETAPRKDAEKITLAMKTAIERAGIKPEQIGYINAHGTSTFNNDCYETFGIKRTFGEYAYKIPISSTKSMIGHTLSGAGAIELIVALETIRRGVIHPTMNCDNPDTDVNYHTKLKEEDKINFQPCDLDYVPNQARERKMDYAMSNSFGFLGHNESMVVGKFKE